MDAREKAKYELELRELKHELNGIDRRVEMGGSYNRHEMSPQAWGGPTTSWLRHELQSEEHTQELGVS